MITIIPDCAKNACREKAHNICPKCKTSFCSLHINDHDEICSID